MAQEKENSLNQDKDKNDLVPLTLRIPKEVHGRLKQLSEAEYRSLNHQIILALSYFIDVQEKLGWLPHPDHMRKNLPAGPSSYVSAKGKNHAPRGTA